MFSFGVSAEIAPTLEEEIDEAEDELIEVLLHTEEDHLHDSNFTQSLDVDVVNNYTELDAAFIELPASSVENVSDREFIDRMEPNYKTEAMLSDSKTQIGVEAAWDTNYTGKDVSVGIMDSGIADHSQLNVENRVDYTGEGTGDLNGHGTHVAGIVASQHPEQTGIAPDAELHDIKVLNQQGGGTAAQMLQGLNYAVKNDLDVAVMSLGSEVRNCNGRDIMSSSADLAANQGTIPVVAAGNIGPEQQTITAPGCSRDGITVGSVDKNNNIAPYSSRGPTADNRVKPDVVAPGSSIVSTGANGGFVRKSGTSMAAPHVGGQAAILLSAGEEPGEIKDIIIDTSEDLGQEPNTQGAGMININNSISPDQQQRSESITSQQKTSFWSRVKNWISIINPF